MSEAREPEVREPEERVVETSRGRGVLSRLGIYAAVLVGAFLLGFVPMWMIAAGRASERDEARRELRLSRIQNRLATATIDARRGEYETARIAISSFYNETRAELDSASDGAIAAGQRASVQPLLADRDEMITLLARSDPSAADRLSNLYVAFARAVDASTAAGQSPAR